MSSSHWFAIWTRSRQEKVAASRLEAIGIPHYLPLTTELRQWSDRKQRVTLPLFSGYLFVQMNPLDRRNLQVLNVPGVAGFVGNSKGPLPIPDQQVEAIRKVLCEQVECTVLPLLEEGDRVRVVRGALAGLEGRLIRSNSASRLLISVQAIHKSLSVNIARQDIEPLSTGAA